MCPRFFGSRPASDSSRINKPCWRGAAARNIATRARWPSLSSQVRRPIHSRGSRTFGSQSLSASEHASWSASPTETRGFSDSDGSCCTSWTCCGALVPAPPVCQSIEPESQRSRPAMHRASVDLPAPDGPYRTTHSPASISMETSSRARTTGRVRVSQSRRWNVLLRRRTASNGCRAALSGGANGAAGLSSGVMRSIRQPSLRKTYSR